MQLDELRGEAEVLQRRRNTAAERLQRMADSKNQRLMVRAKGGAGRLVQRRCGLLAGQLGVAGVAVMGWRCQAGARRDQPGVHRVKSPLLQPSPQGLDTRYRGIAAMHHWVAANRGRFRGPVYGPVAVEVECPDPRHQQYLEQHVAGGWRMVGWR